jgi:hypothetical protein
LPKSPEEQEASQRAEIKKLWSRALDEFDETELAELGRRVALLSDEDAAGIEIDQGPKNERELQEWFQTRIGVTIPEVAVCPGHVAPFEIACDIYFFRILRLLWIGSRGGTKTSLMAWLDLAASENFPGFGSWTTGPGLAQGERKYEHLLPFVVEGGVIGGKELPHVAKSTQTHTIFKNGSKIGIGPGTVAANNGPREPRLHRDERELMDPPVYKQAGNIPAGRQTTDGRYIPAQIIDTSTMKWAHGDVAKEKEEYEKAIAEGRRPRMIVKTSCIFEITQEKANCRAVPPEQRETRLKELGRDPCELCDCDSYVNDVWDEEDDHTGGVNRTLEDVCAGRFFQSRGFKDFSDIQTLFLENDRYTWEAEQECAQASKEGVYVKSYSQVRNGIRGWEPDPSYGLIYQGVDWGGADAHSIGWYQLLDRDVVALSYLGSKLKVLRKNTLIRFSEIYRAGVGNVDIGKAAIARENKWRARWPGWRVHERYPDSANLSGRLDWRDHLGLETVSRIAKDFDAELRYIRQRVGKGEFMVDIGACPMFDSAIRAWHEENGHEVHDWSSHPMAEYRYVEHNLQVVGRRRSRSGHNQNDPAADTEQGVEEDRGSIPSAPRQRPEDGGEIMGVAGAEPSPVRAGAGRMSDPGRGGTLYPGFQ